MKHILVTGGAGYIGAHFVHVVLRETNFRITVLDNFLQGRKNIIKNKRVVYKKIDISNAQAVEKIFKKKIDAVVHFAALASVPDSVAFPEKYYTTNVVGGLNLLEAMRKKGVRRIIFSSSASVYGEPQKKVISEEHPTEPINPYGYTKLVFENMLAHYHQSYQFDSISFRYFCASGCDESLEVGEHHYPETHVIPCLLNTVFGKQKKFFVYGNDFKTPDKTGVRDYIHVNDLASAHVLALKKLFSEKNICSVYNLGINRGYSVMELIKAVEKISGKKINYEIKSRRPGDPSVLIADATKANKELAWSPEYVDIEEIIRSAYLFFKKKI